jgi:hypothetical protein
MASADSDLNYFKAGLEEIEAYLNSSEIYWPIGISAPIGQPPYPQLTLDSILLARARLKARKLNPEQTGLFHNLESKLDEVLINRAAAWSKKASALYRARLNLWKSYLNDYRADPEGNHDRYAYEVTRRVQLELLDPFSEGHSQAEIDLLISMDAIVKACFLPGDFVWEPELAEAFPPPHYWYLYGRLKHKPL